MNTNAIHHLPAAEFIDPLLLDAIYDLERATSQVLSHNANRMKAPRVKSWLNGVGKEPQNGEVGIVSIMPAVQIRKRLDADEDVTIADVAAAIAKMQRGIVRAERLDRRRAERRRQHDQAAQRAA